MFKFSLNAPMPFRSENFFPIGLAQIERINCGAFFGGDFRGGNVQIKLGESLRDHVEEADAVLAVDYRGLSVKQAVELRTALNDAGANFRIVKNTLTERAADKAGAESLKALLEGPTALTFVSGDVALAAKALSQFRRREGILEFKGGQMHGEELSVDQIEAIARLPAREQLYAQLVGITASPLTGLVRGLNSLIQGLAVQLGERLRRARRLSPGLSGPSSSRPPARWWA